MYTKSSTLYTVHYNNEWNPILASKVLFKVFFLNITWILKNLLEMVDNRVGNLIVYVPLSAIRTVFNLLLHPVADPA